VHPGEAAEAVGAEARVERRGDDGVAVTPIERSLDLHTADRLGEVVQLVGGHVTQRLDEVGWLRLHFKMLATVRNATSVASKTEPGSVCT